MNKIFFIFIVLTIVACQNSSPDKNTEQIQVSSNLRNPQLIALKQGTTLTFRKSWWQKLKESFFTASLGVFFFFFSLPLLWFNERRQVEMNEMLSDAKKTAIVLSPEKVSLELEGKLVYTTGLTKTQDSLLDDDINIIFDDVIKVKRKVEMLQLVQFVEGKSDADYFSRAEDTSLTIKYEKVWTELAIDSSNFRDQNLRGSNPNPNSWIIRSKWYKASSVKIGQHDLNYSQMDRLLLFDHCVIENFKVEKFSANLRARLNGAHVYNTKNEIYFRFRNPNEDSIGDMRITYSLYRNKDLTIVAEQHGSSFASYDLTTKSLGNRRGPYYENRGREQSGFSFCFCCFCCGMATACADALCQSPREIDWLFEKKMTKEQAFDELKAMNGSLTWMFRFIGFFVLWLGIFCFFSPLYEFLMVVPLLSYFGQFVVAIFALLVAVPLTIAIIALAWLFYRPLVTILLAVIIVPFVLYLNRVGEEAQKAGALKVFF